MKRILFLFVLLLCYTVSTMAVPAYRGTAQVRQPDGSYITLRLLGDEWINFNTTVDGYSVVKDQRGYYVYAEKKNGILQSTSYVAHDVSKRSHDEQAFLAHVKKYQAPEMSTLIADMKARVETAGAQRRAQRRAAKYDFSKFKGLIVLVQFNDKEFSRPDYKDIIADMVNMKDYKGYDNKKMPGSVRDYFSDNSNGKFKPQFDVVGPYTVNFSQYDCNRNDIKCTEVLIAALDSADVDVNFKDYDGDGDKAVDLVYFIIAGNGANYSGNNADLWWPHRSFLWKPNSQNWRVYKDGMFLYDYASSTELAGFTAQPNTIYIDGIGTICHEFSHVLGLPDFYDSNYDENGTSNTPGEWSLMDSGSYADNGFTPVGYSLFERYSVGFIDEPEKIEAEGAYTLNPLSSSYTGFRIDSPVKNEFFLLENRQNSGFKWDAYLPGHGLLVHRVDLNDEWIWQSNTVNANADRNYYELVRAGGAGMDAAYDVFPGPGRVSSLHNGTSPANLRTWNGQTTKWGLFNISESNGVVTFDVQDALTLTSLSLPKTAELGRGISMKLEPLFTPDYAETTLKWSSTNEDVAVVDDEGVVVGIEEGTCVITVVSENGLEANCQLTVIELPNLSIAEFKQLGVGSEAKLQFNQAQVVFASGSTAYIRDASSAIILDGLNMNLETNDILDGVIYVKYALNNQMPYAMITDATDVSALNVEKGSEVEPREMKLDDLTEADYADYVLLKQTKLVLESGRVWAVSDNRRIRYFNKLGVKVSLKNYSGKFFDLPVIYGTDMLNGKLIDELYILKQPTEVNDPTGIVELRQDDADANRPFFNLQGQRVSPNTKGLLIRGGRKLLNR